MNLRLQELSFTLYARDLNPATISPAILRYVEIVPADWALVENPVHSDRELKLVFNNRVRLIVQPNRAFFAETVGDKKLEDIQIPTIVENYLKIFSGVNYQAMSVAPSGFKAFESDSAVSEYLAEKLLTSDPWQKFDDRSLNAIGIKLGYPYKSGNFYLDINQANVEMANVNTPAVWFAGNFNYPLLSNSKQEKILSCHQLLQQWQTDVVKFIDFIDRKFLASVAAPEFSVFPSNNL